MIYVNVLTVLMCVLISTFACGEETANPLRNAKVGDWAIYKHLSTFRVSKTEVVESKVTVTVVANDGLVVNLKRESQVENKNPEVSEMSIDLSKPLSLGDMLGYTDKAALQLIKFESLGEGMETVLLDCGKFESSWRRYEVSRREKTIDDTSSSHRSKVWTSPAAPLLGVVRTIGEHVGRFPTDFSTTNTLELVDFGPRSNSEKTIVDTSATGGLVNDGPKGKDEVQKAKVPSKSFGELESVDSKQIVQAAMDLGRGNEAAREAAAELLRGLGRAGVPTLCKEGSSRGTLSSFDSFVTAIRVVAFGETAAEANSRIRDFASSPAVNDAPLELLPCLHAERDTSEGAQRAFAFLSLYTGGEVIDTLNEELAKENDPTRRMKLEATLKMIAYTHLKRVSPLTEVALKENPLLASVPEEIEKREGGAVLRVGALAIADVKLYIQDKQRARQILSVAIAKSSRSPFVPESHLRELDLSDRLMIALNTFGERLMVQLSVGKSVPK